eukprot:4015243-Amphidinium_carterae.1
MGINSTVSAGLNASNSTLLVNISFLKESLVVFLSGVAQKKFKCFGVFRVQPSLGDAIMPQGNGQTIGPNNSTSIEHVND